VRPDFFHTSLYDLAALGTLFSGLTLALLVGFAKRLSQPANLFLSLALGVIVVKTGGLSAAFLPALGPLLFFYTKHRTGPDWRFQRKDWLHFCPLLVGGWLPVWPILISILIYLYAAHRLIQAFYSRLKPVLMDRPRFAFRGLEKALILLGWSCLLTFVNDSFFLAIAFVLMGMVVEVILKLDSPVKLTMPIADRSDARQKGRKLREAVAANHLYEDAELTLTTLALKLGVHPHELSRIINLGLDKNFNDFINECRVREIARKMRDPAYDRLTLLGIAYESGFNSKTTFNRVFKQMTGQTPVDYKNSLKKEVPIDKLALPSPIQPLVLRLESLSTKATDISNRNNSSLHPIMLRNYFNIAFRNLISNKVYSALNLIGLTTGLTVGLLILLWVRHERSYDQFHRDTGNIYRVLTNVGKGDSRQIWSHTHAPLATFAQADLPEVKNTVRIRDNRDIALLTYADKQLTGDRKAYVDPSFFAVFDFPLAKGNAKRPFQDNQSVVLTASTARRYFGDEEPVGKVLTAEGREQVVVTGVLEDFPANSSLQYDMLFPMSRFARFAQTEGGKPIDEDWGSFTYDTYLQLTSGTVTKPTERKLAHMLRTRFRDIGIDDPYSLQPLANMHLYKTDGSEGLIQTVRIFLIIGILILVVACINYVNLAMARSSLRAKEVGVRKLIGAAKGQLFIQFLLEAALMFGVSAVAALLLIQVLLPVFNTIADKTLTLPLADPQLWLVIGLTLLATLALTSIYPALLLSSFEPLQALKGKLSAGISAAFFRKLLVTGQFVISVTLISSTLIIDRQLSYIRGKELGYDKEYVFSVDMGNMQPQAQFVKTELMKQPGVRGITYASDQLINLGMTTGKTDWEGKDPDQRFFVHPLTVDADFLSVFKLPLVAGQGFRGIASDSAHFILNETAVKEAGIQNPIGKRFTLWDTEGTIIGVVKDFHFASLKQRIEPAIFQYQPGNSLLYVKTSGADAAKALAAVEARWKQYNASLPFTYSFLDDAYDSLYKSEQRTGTLFTLFSVVAILISCLGLFGLATYAAQLRTREIGVRKVLGASVPSIIQLLSKDFLQVVILAIVLATPLAWYVMNRWLADFAYKIAIDWWVFALAGLLAIGISLLTVGYQSIKAALMNPVKSLRSE
jgi:putative ABC transport system permease protein